MGPLEVTDAELVQRIRSGDDAAFRALVERHGNSLFGLAYTLLGSAADAEDVVQETFLGAFRRLGAFEGRSAVKTWLTRILLNHASKLRRSKRVRKAESVESPRASDDRSLRTASAATAVDSRVDVMQMLDVLSPDHRQVIVLRELEGLSYEEIAEALGVPRGTVESRLHRARQELKQRFAGYLS